MNMSNTEYLRQLIAELRFEQGVDVDELKSILDLPDMEERAGSPERFLARFALERAKKRLSSSKRYGKITMGVESLIESMKSIDKGEYVDCYNMESKKLIGSCFVRKEAIIGYEFVQKGETKSYPRLRKDLLD